MTHSALARVSDDFYPRLPASHTSHVAACAFNSLLCFSALVQPDWDMFHSQHPRWARVLVANDHGCAAPARACW
jgi:raffinose synthase